LKVALLRLQVRQFFLDSYFDTGIGCQAHSFEAIGMKAGIAIACLDLGTNPRHCPEIFSCDFGFVCISKCIHRMQLVLYAIVQHMCYGLFSGVLSALMGVGGAPLTMSYLTLNTALPHHLVQVLPLLLHAAGVDKRELDQTYQRDQLELMCDSEDWGSCIE